MSTQEVSTKQITINIGGMGCSGCANTIQEALASKEGAVEAAVDLESGTALVTYNPDAVSTDDFEQAIKEAGYDFVGIK
ncbi:heavy metal-associated domain-containing protein [Fodinibius sp. Rm-B-1B1-1]|uniref:heavy-metal-associated domain-containing protein n=1 Tax=Fodinibius alkaliphilus TaxID=3140241 RepID=UPI00315AF583